MSRAEELLKSMNLVQKLGHMICLRGYKFEQKMRESLSEGVIGCVGRVFFLESHIEELENMLKCVNSYLSKATVPVMFYIDGEQGLAQGHSFGTSFPTMMALGATFSKELAYRMGKAIGKETRAIGYSVISNPVLDVNSNPDNPIINTRAISDNADLIIELAGEYVKGLQEEGVLPTAKHFPGHGDTNVDSHVSMPIVDRTAENLMNIDIRPYSELIKKGMLGIMTAHILMPALLGPDESNIPATLSRNIMYNLLRKQLGFEGLLFSDSLTMKGIKDNYGIEKAAVLAIKAGHDIILQDYNSDPEITYNALQAAVEAGELSMELIDEAVLRILGFKEKLGLLDNVPVDIGKAKEILGCQDHIRVAEEIADSSVTVLEAADLPFDASALNSDTAGKVLLIATRSPEEGGSAEDMSLDITGKGSFLFERLKEYTKQADVCVVNEDPSARDLERVKTMLSDNKYRYIIFGTFIRVISYKKGSGTIPQSQIDLIDILKQCDTKLAFLIFGSPYILRKMNAFDNCICAYGDCNYSINAALKVLFGRMKATGKLPVNVNEKYKYGYGLEP